MNTLVANDQSNLLYFGAILTSIKSWMDGTIKNKIPYIPPLETIMKLSITEMIKNVCDFFIKPIMDPGYSKSIRSTINSIIDQSL
jgi:hypothetical protein